MAESKKTVKKSKTDSVASEETVVSEKPKTPRPPRRAAKTADAAPVTTDTETTEAVPSLNVPKGKYVFALGRRKTSIARVRMSSGGKGETQVNGKNFAQYFQTFEQRDCISAPLRMTGQEGALDFTVSVAGGGLMAQAEAVRLGMSRALVELNPAYRKTLKKLGYLSRDPRAKERKKPGLRRARRSPQWSKR